MLGTSMLDVVHASNVPIPDTPGDDDFLGEMTPGSSTEWLRPPRVRHIGFTSDSSDGGDKNKEKRKALDCSNCGGDHYAYNCPEGGARNKGKGKSWFCFTCREYHLARDCPERLSMGKSKGKGVCYKFRAFGVCKFGNNCRFLHSQHAAVLAGTPWQQQMQMQQQGLQQRQRAADAEVQHLLEVPPYQVDPWAHVPQVFDDALPEPGQHTPSSLDANFHWSAPHPVTGDSTLQCNTCNRPWRPRFTNPIEFTLGPLEHF